MPVTATTISAKVQMVVAELFIVMMRKATTGLYPGTDVFNAIS